MDEKDILNLIKSDPWMMQVLTITESFHLPDWLIGAGFVRNKVWDHLHGYTVRTTPSDIDLVYFDKENIFNVKEVKHKLERLMPELIWEVVNQANAHEDNGDAPYASTFDAISKWPETATAVGVTLKEGRLTLIAPLGIQDLVNIIARPTPAFNGSEKKQHKVKERIAQKNWQEKWPKLQILLEQKY